MQLILSIDVESETNRKMSSVEQTKFKEIDKNTVPLNEVTKEMESNIKDEIVTNCSDIGHENTSDLGYNINSEKVLQDDINEGNEITVSKENVSDNDTDLNDTNVMIINENIKKEENVEFGGIELQGKTNSKNSEQIIENGYMSDNKTCSLDKELVQERHVGDGDSGNNFDKGSIQNSQIVSSCLEKKEIINTFEISCNNKDVVLQDPQIKNTTHTNNFENHKESIVSTDNRQALEQITLSFESIINNKQIIIDIEKDKIIQLSEEDLDKTVVNVEDLCEDERKELSLANNLKNNITNDNKTCEGIGEVDVENIEKTAVCTINTLENDEILLHPLKKIETNSINTRINSEGGEKVEVIVNNVEHSSTVNVKNGSEDAEEKNSIAVDTEKGKSNLVAEYIPVISTEQKKVTNSSRLSNTLNILSDDEEYSPQGIGYELKPEPMNKQCISLDDDDDDIMLIDDEPDLNENKSVMTTDSANEFKNETKEINDISINKNTEEELINNSYNDIKNNAGVNTVIETDKNLEKKEIIEDKKIENRSALLPPDFLKTFKKTLINATREELEDFCILKIVESVFNKSNLGEIKSQLKDMFQTVEEYKNKAKMLSKQNRDLQVVLKSVQEELKKISGAPITPLKITRSVGMQVLMTDKNSRKRQSLPNSQTTPNSNLSSQSEKNTLNKNQNRGQNNQIARTSKPQQQIPVPRLVPAVNNGTAKCSPNTPQMINTPVKLSPVNNTPNGIKPSPPGKPEKRTHSKMQQSNSITVDLTEDEPPSKVLNRLQNSQVRCVPPQSLLAPQRQPHAQTLNSPRKVYIPISGPQSQSIKPGQTIMFKSVPSGARPRGPSPNLKLAPHPLRLNKVSHRHPAPLPIDSVKQYEPPNWKAIPPAPELKSAKVDNGIVISWKIDEYREEIHEDIVSYQLFAYQETSAPPSTSLWKKIGDVKALPLPMACTLTQFMAGYKYYFAVRAIDAKSRVGPFSLPGSILLLNKI